MQREDDQQLWDLLGRTAEPKLSPFFARNVLREIRPASRFGRAQDWFSLRRLVAASAVAVVVIGMAIATHAPRWSQESPEREPDECRFPVVNSTIDLSDREPGKDCDADRFSVSEAAIFMTRPITLRK